MPDPTHMFLEIISPKKIEYRGEVSLVQMPGEMGSFEVLKNHAPLVARLAAGRVKIIDAERNTVMVDITPGVVHVRDNHLMIITQK